MRNPTLPGCTALALCLAAQSASAHVIYTTGFEVGQTAPGLLRGQDLWSDTPLNQFVVSTQAPGEEGQSILFAPGGSGTSLAHRPTDQISMHGWPGMTILMVSAMVRVDNLRSDSSVNLNIRTVDEITGGALNIGLQDGHAYIGSALHDAPLLIGPEIMAGEWAEIMLELDMETGDVMGSMNGMMFGMFHIPVDMLQMDASSGVTMSASFQTSGPGDEMLQVDAIRVMHMMPSPGAAGVLLLGLGAMPRRRR